MAVLFVELYSVNDVGLFFFPFWVTQDEHHFEIGKNVV